MPNVDFYLGSTKKRFSETGKKMQSSQAREEAGMDDSIYKESFSEVYEPKRKEKRLHTCLKLILMMKMLMI